MRRLGLFIVAVLLAIGVPVLLGACATPALINRMSDHLFTVLSILAGFMTAAMAMLGEHAIIFSRNEEYASGEWRRWRFASELYFVHTLFVLSLSAILLILLAVPAQALHAGLGFILQMFGIGMGVFATVLAFRLPFYLLDLQKKRIDEASEEHKKTHRERLKSMP